MLKRILMAAQGMAERQQKRNEKACRREIKEK